MRCISYGVLSGSRCVTIRYDAFECVSPWIKCLNRNGGRRGLILPAPPPKHPQEGAKEKNHPSDLVFDLIWTYADGNADYRRISKRIKLRIRNTYSKATQFDISNFVYLFRKNINSRILCWIEFRCIFGSRWKSRNSWWPIHGGTSCEWLWLTFWMRKVSPKSIKNALNRWRRWVPTSFLQNLSTKPMIVSRFRWCRVVSENPWNNSKSVWPDTDTPLLSLQWFAKSDTQRGIMPNYRVERSRSSEMLWFLWSTLEFRWTELPLMRNVIVVRPFLRHSKWARRNNWVCCKLERSYSIHHTFRATCRFYPTRTHTFELR